MSRPDSTPPLSYLISFFNKKMASNDFQYGLNERERLELGHRMLLAEQQRRLESRRILEASTRAPVCPNYSVVGHSGCWYCRQNGTSSTSTDNLLRSLARPQFQVAFSIHESDRIS